MGALTHNGEVLQSLPANASQINFDKTGTDLNSTQTENAIKEVNTKANTNANDIDQLKSGLTAQSVTFTPATGVTIDTSVMYKCSNILLGTLWLTVPTTLISAASELGTFNVSVANMFRTIGIATSQSISGQIGHFRISPSGSLSVDNNFALPAEGSYKLDITVPISS